MTLDIIIKSARASLLILLLSSCEMDLFSDFDPCQATVEITSIEKVAEGIVVSGRIIDGGISEVKYVGFSFSEEGEPGILDNQILYSGSKEFSTTIGGLTQYANYNFKAFAANDCGLAESAVVEYETGAAIAPTVPCTLSNNTIINNGDGYEATIYAGQAVATYGNYGIEANCYSSGGPTVELNFHEMPVTGTYYTKGVPEFSNSESNVYISIQQGSTRSSVHPDGEVYVERQSSGSIIVTFCDLTYSAFSSDWPLAGKVAVD